MTPVHGRANVGRRSRTYQQRLCTDIEDLPEAMDDRDEYRPTESVKSVLVVRHDDDDDDIYLYKFKDIIDIDLMGPSNCQFLTCAFIWPDKGIDEKLLDTIH